jgi:hypothetical protein
MTTEILKLILEDYETWRKQLLDRSIHRVTDGTYRRSPEQKSRDLKSIAHVERIIGEIKQELERLAKQPQRLF